MNERQPTIIKIKALMSELNDEINVLAKEHVVVSDWSIKGMKKPFYIKKYNSARYDTNEERPYSLALNHGWWGDSHATTGHNWGVNKFPDDTKAWWIGDSDMISWRWEGVFNFAYFYYLYEADEAETVSIYKVGWNNNLKVNGQSVDFRDGNATFNLVAGKNVFEITVIPGIPSSGTVLYVSSDKYNTILFRTGDPDWGVSYSPVPDYTLITSRNIKNEETRDILNEGILFKINDIDTLLTNIEPIQKDNLKFKETNTAPLLAQLNDLKATYRQLQKELKKPLLLEGNYEVSGIKTAAIFSNYMLILVFTLFFVVSLIYIYKNPEVGNLDLFILAIAIMILLYYLYEYIQKRRRIGKRTT